MWDRRYCQQHLTEHVSRTCLCPRAETKGQKAFKMNDNLTAKIAEFVSSIAREVPSQLLPEITQLTLEEMVRIF